MAGSAFTFGVKPGGLTENTEVRILLCYLIKTVAPMRPSPARRLSRRCWASSW